MAILGLEQNSLSTVITYTLLWTGFGIQHSLLASSWAKRAVSLPPSTYRKVYNVIALTTLAPILYYSYPGIFPLFRKLFLYQELTLPVTQFATAVILLTIALLLLTHAFSALGPEGVRGFLGLQVEPKTLSFQGPYKYCRHPIYTATFIAIAGAFLLSPTLPALVSSISASLYLIIGSTFEEQRLQAEFPQYQKYMKRVGKFFPWRLSHLEAVRNPDSFRLEAS